MFINRNREEESNKFDDYYAVFFQIAGRVEFVSRFFFLHKVKILLKINDYIYDTFKTYTNVLYRVNYRAFELPRFLIFLLRLLYAAMI